MTTQTFHGPVTPHDIARALMATFNRNNLIARQFGNGESIVVQIGSRSFKDAGGKTALTVNLKEVEDGVSVQMGEQSWFGVVASLGVTGLWMLRNPLSLIGRLDDLAADIESIQLADEVIRVIQQTMQLAGASHKISERLRRLSCEYCGTANPVGEPQCIACGAPLGEVQPSACPNCGYIVSREDASCPNCGTRLR